MRYIDADKLKRDLIDNRCFYPTIIKNAIENAPTEDVVPRAEVERYQICDDGSLKMIPTVESVRQATAREIFEELGQEIELALDSNYKAREEHLAKYKTPCDEFIDVVNGKIFALEGILDFFTELKKKYIGE